MNRFNLLVLITLCGILCILPTILSAQWLETTIYIPDSLSDVKALQVFV
jgi:hypothetical protein